MKKNNLYLTSLRIQNYATFTQQEINFCSGFNAIVGETGSGKSLILDALQLIFGGRADKKTIRKGAEFASVEATFFTAGEDIKSYFDEIGHPFVDNEITVKRIIYPTGSSKAFLNFQLCPLNTLSQFAKRFIDLVGQFENQKLLSEDYQLVLLDQYANNKSLLKEYQSTYQQYQTLLKRKEELEQKSDGKSKREDYLNFQIEEVENLGPSVEEEEKLIEKKNAIQGWQKQRSTIQMLLNTLSENEEGNVLNSLQLAEKHQEDLLTALPDSSHDTVNRLSEAKAIIEDFCYELSKSFDHETDEDEFNQIIDRLDLYQKLKRKFGGTTEDILKAYEEFKSEREELEKIEVELKTVTQQIQECETTLTETADKLHKRRKKNADELSKKLTASVRSLKMLGASIDFKIQKTDKFGPRGQDSVSLISETNPGEGAFPVKQIASGGELSRILLAIRQILSTSDSVSVFLFDEIDTGMGGETAQCIGSALENVASEGQVIAITHLPQIAKFAEQLVCVEKDIQKRDNRTISKAQVLTGKESEGHIREMASI